MQCEKGHLRERQVSLFLFYFFVEYSSRLLCCFSHSSVVAKKFRIFPKILLLLPGDCMKICCNVSPVYGKNVIVKRFELLAYNFYFYVIRATKRKQETNLHDRLPNCDYCVFQMT